MKTLVVSDLHTEFHGSNAIKFLSTLADAEAIIIAGDLSPICMVDLHLEYLATRYEHVIFVPGNHEFYDSDLDYGWDDLREMDDRIDNLHILNNSDVVIGGTRFLGATMWFPYSGYDPNQDGMSDFHVIGSFSELVGQHNNETVDYFNSSIKEGDVVITHHLPTTESVCQHFKNSPLNAFFVCPVDRMIYDRKPSVWIHGHTHSSCDYSHFGTRILCNPYGYVNHWVNPTWDPSLIVDL